MEKSTTILALLAIPTVLAPALWLLQLTWLHFIHKSNLAAYLASNSSSPDKASWALVTGASDGIGFGFVQELAAQGFNIILHGRNKTKLEGLISQVSKQYPSQKFKIFVLDVTERDKWQTTIKAFTTDLETSKINVRILINNVGGSGGSFFAFDKMAERDPVAITKTIDMNATFSTVITQAILPILTESQPSLILTIGSIAGIFPPPYLALYAGSKAFNSAWSDSLYAEMRAEKSNIEVMHVLVGRVINSTSKGKKGSLFEPLPRDFASAALQKVGCGMPSVTAYWPHDLQISFLRLVPSWILAGVLADASVKEMKEERKGR